MTLLSGPRRLAVAALVLGTGAAFVHAGLPAQLAAPVCRLYLDPHDKFTRVVADDTAQRRNALTADARLSSITVRYGAGFPGTAQVAFQAAVDIWQTQVSSPIDIVIDANWVDFGNAQLLGEAGANCAFHDFAGATRPGTWFVSAIAERLAGAFLSGSCASPREIGASFNSTASWYLGTDGVPTSGTVDFESVVLHELGHGLGFIGTGNVSSGLGAVGDQGLPYIYDANIVDSAGTSILSAGVYPNGSTTMASLLQGTGVSGAGLFWGGANAASANAGVRPVLYAPGSFQLGSSYSHLDENTYPAGNLNSLMTPVIGFAEVIHTPGPVMLGSFADMGWGNQTGSGCSFGLDQYTASVPASGGAVSVELVTAGGCGWTASTSASFVSGLSPASGTTSARLQMSVAANPNTAARVATVTIGTETLTIAQQGTSACVYSLSPSGVTVGSAGQSGSVALTSAPGCAWTATSSDGTVAAITTDPPSGQDSASIGYVVSGNPGPAVRSATLTIGGQTFAITQAACGYAVDNNPLTVTGAMTTVTLNVSTAPSCQWKASSSASFITIQNGAIGTGPGSVQFSVAANPTLSSRSGNVTVAGLTVTINQGGGLPTMALDKTSLSFGARANGSALVMQTSAQVIQLAQSGLPGTVTWTASADQPWLKVAPASGSGTGSLTISVAFDPSLPVSGTVTGSVTISLHGASGPVGPIAVRLTMYPPGQPRFPFGSIIETPAFGATGLSGSIAVTGWALDYIEVTRATICRDQVVGESLPFDPRCGGTTQVFIGDGTFVDGARPDVAAAFPTFPLNTRAGWGYLLLTNLLPNGGNGTFNLYLHVTNASGDQFQFGQTTITCDNADAIAPFGAIDTPGQGEIVRGVVANYGWVLSPGARRADPPGGGTVTVYVDGAPVGSPGGWAARPDLSALFPASQYAGIDTALGVFGLDTTRLANGLHTISWSVTDDLGVTSGIGSRFFTVSNGSAVADGAARLSAARPGSARLGSARPTPAGADGLRDAGAGTMLLGRVGFDLIAPLKYFFPNADGVVTIHAQELDRIELHLEPGATGVQITLQGERPLPVGARLNSETGVFTWTPGPGFLGAYDFQFGDQRVRIVIEPHGRL